MRANFATIAFVLLLACGVTQASAQQRLTGNITAAAPRVSFPVQLQAGQVVTLSTTDADFDTVLTLKGPNGRTVAENDDQQQGVLTSRIVHVPDASGAYTAIVSSFNGATGAFALNVTQGLVVGLSDAARTLREERVSLHARRTEARYEVNLRADDIFVATTFALTDDLDSTLTLLDASGAVLAQNDDRGDGTLNSQIIYEVAHAGRYTIVVGTYESQGRGDLILNLATDPNAEAPFNFAAIEGTPLESHDGDLNAEQPSRDYTLQLAQGQTILALAEAASGNLDTVLRLNGPDGFPVALNDDRGDGSLNSAFAFTAPATGVYELEIYRYQRSDTSGAFRLVISSVDRAVVDTLQALVENPVVLSGPEQVIETQDFRVHYTTEGGDAATPEYARATADALQDALAQQTTRLGWAAPIRDRDGRYRAYIADAEGNMGYTKPVQIMFDNPNTTNVRERAAARAALVIENDFANMEKEAPPESLMRATATHELNHALQFGYDSEEELGWLYEATASWIETATAGDDQDATDYVATDFAAPQMCWTTATRGFDYAQWTLLQSLADQYGDTIVANLWANSVQYDGFETMTQTLASVGTTIPDALQRWRLQNFARDYRLAPRFTRTVHLQGTIRRDGAWTTKGGIEQLGAHYIAIAATGARAYTLNGDDTLAMFGLGQHNGQIEIVPLGRAGTFDASGYQYAALMVFNRAVPSAPGECSEARYSISVAQTSQRMAAPQLRLSAAHFAEPTAD